jgi:signal transduction histidine kinase
MYFNLIMNAADAMVGSKSGGIHVSDIVEGDGVVLRVRDNGSGMAPEKIRQLLAERETLDGELHSLGFVFVRQTVAEFDGEISIDSAVGEGTTVTVRLPVPPGKGTSATPASERREARRTAGSDTVSAETMPMSRATESANREARS